MSSDSSRFIASLARDKINLKLSTLDLCYLAGLYLRAERAAVTSFEEDVLLDMYEQSCDFVDPGTEHPRKRATFAIQRLRDQRMLARVDGAGIVQSGEYALTRLAHAVVGFFIDEETLTRESLTLLTTTLRAQLAEVLSEAKRADCEDAWLKRVVDPLRVTVAELVNGIDRRQRGLDTQQEEVKEKIANLLQEQWLESLNACQSLLDTTADTLKELNEVLLRDTSHLLTILQEIHALAEQENQQESEETVQRVIEHIDRIAAWGRTRQRAWSQFYESVHRFICDVVRLDPDRAISQRLRDQIANWSTSTFYVNVAAAPSIRLIRQLDSRTGRPPVVRPLKDREADPILVQPENVALVIENLVNEALASGAKTLAEVTEWVLSNVPQNFPPNSHYAIVGRVANVLPRIKRMRSALERPWRTVAPNLELEDWEPPKVESRK